MRSLVLGRQACNKMIFFSPSSLSNNGTQCYLHCAGLAPLCSCGGRPTIPTPPPTPAKAIRGCALALTQVSILRYQSPASTEMCSPFWTEAPNDVLSTILSLAVHKGLAIYGDELDNSMLNFVLRSCKCLCAMKSIKFGVVVLRCSLNDYSVPGYSLWTDV